MLWTDSDDAPARIARVADLEIRARLQAMRDSGLVSFPGLIPPAACDRIIADFERFCEAHPEEAERFRLPTGFHSRFYNLHTISDAALQAALHPMVLDMLDHLFTHRAALNSTHFFEQGSEQAIHRDTPFFYTDPLPGEFTGAWFALEEVDIEAGPLVYIPGGHRIQIDIEVVRAAGGAEAMFDRYCRLVIEACRSQGREPVPLTPRKGDVVLWHPDLPHGGSVISRRGATRRSLVAHYIPEGAYVQPVGYFFGIHGTQKIMDFTPTANGRLMRWVDRPVFMPNA